VFTAVPHNKPWRPMGLCDVQVRTFLDNRLTDCDEVVCLMSRPRFTVRNIPGTYFY
jgi:hypothetical protein